MFHAYGLTLCLTFAMSMGARLVLFPSFDPDLVLKVVKKHPPTFLPAVPPIYDRLTKAAAAEGVSLDGISIAISGAMPLSAEVVEPWEAQTDGYLVEGYGLSETLARADGQPGRAQPHAPAPSACRCPSTEVRVVDPEEPDTDVAAGAEGELIVRGPQVFSGYWKKPEETEAVFVPADRRRRRLVPHRATSSRSTPTGSCSIVDRIKELIITGGFNVAPSEVEEAAARAPRRRGLRGRRPADDHSGEEVVAAVVLRDGATLDEAAIRAFARDSAHRLQGAEARGAGRRAAEVAHRQGAAPRGAQHPPERLSETDVPFLSPESARALAELVGARRAARPCCR